MSGPDAAHLRPRPRPGRRFLARARLGVLGTSDVAGLCGVRPGTAARWVDRGYLPGFREPSRSGRPSPRRVRVRDLLAFAAEHMPHKHAYLCKLLDLREAQWGSILDGDDVGT